MAIRDNIRKKKVIVSGGGGSGGGGSSVGTSDIANGFTARFFDEENNVIQVSRVISGLWLDKPQYECDSWQNSNGFVNSFPLLLEGDADFYAKSNQTYADLLYVFYGIAKAEYPYVHIMMAAQNKHKLTFAKTWVKDGDYYRMSECLQVESDSSTQPSAYADIKSVAQSVMLTTPATKTFETKGSFSDKYNNTYWYHYSNFANEHSKWYRLDVPVEQ